MQPSVRTAGQRRSSRRGFLLQQAEAQQALGARDERILARARRPSEKALRLRAGGVLGLAELGQDLPEGGVRELMALGFAGLGVLGARKARSAAAAG